MARFFPWLVPAVLALAWSWVGGRLPAAPLHDAARDGDVEAVRPLLARGTNPDPRGFEELTPQTNCKDTGARSLASSNLAPFLRSHEGFCLARAMAGAYSRQL